MNVTGQWIVETLRNPMKTRSRFWEFALGLASSFEKNAGTGASDARNPIGGASAEELPASEQQFAPRGFRLASAGNPAPWREPSPAYTARRSTSPTIERVTNLGLQGGLET
jgi:hypothetical protein